MQDDNSLMGNCLVCCQGMTKEAPQVAVPLNPGQGLAHTKCFRCQDCGKSLVAQEFVTIENELKQKEEAKAEESASTGTTIPHAKTKLTFLCEEDYYKRKGSTCGRCGLAIRENEEAMMVEGSSWHKRHLSCFKCGEHLEEKVYLREGKVYCEKDFVSLFLICAGCGEKILENCSVGMGKFWHKHCFKCSICGNTILQNEEFVYKDKAAFHERCFNDANPICAKCGNTCQEECVEFQSKQYHPKCFVCTQCGAVLDPSKFLLIDGKRCCPSHAQFQCCVCKDPILGGFVHIGQRKWHVNHFRCDRCARSLKLGQEHVLPHIERVLCRQCIHGGEGSIEPIPEESLNASQLTELSILQPDDSNPNISTLSMEKATVTYSEVPESRSDLQQVRVQSSKSVTVGEVEKGGSLGMKSIVNTPRGERQTEKKKSHSQSKGLRTPKIMTMSDRKEEKKQQPKHKFSTERKGSEKRIKGEQAELKIEEKKEQASEWKPPAAIKSLLNLTKPQDKLSSSEFQKAFGISREAFGKLPMWQRLQLKKKAGLF